jgi:hypothetical protein
MLNSYNQVISSATFDIYNEVEIYGKDTKANLKENTFQIG